MARPFTERFVERVEGEGNWDFPRRKPSGIFVSPTCSSTGPRGARGKEGTMVPRWMLSAVAQIERIEIIRGGGGLIYGEGA